KNAVDVSVFETPKNALRPIAADADVDGFATTVEFIPNFGARSFPALGDRIADEENVDFASIFADPFVEQFVTFEGASGARFRLGWRRFRGLGAQAASGNCDGEKEEGGFLHLVFRKLRIRE